MAAVSEASGAAIVDVGVPEEHRTMSIEKVFWSHFTPNFNAPTWIIGLLLAALGLDLWWGILALVLGTLVGVLPTAFSALMGPVTGLTQIENSRFSFGRTGTRLPAAINAIMCVGWVAVGNVPATFAVIALLERVGITLPFSPALAVLAALEAVPAVYGHHAVQWLQKYVGYWLVAGFGLIVVASTISGGSTNHAHHAFSLAAFATALGVAASTTLSWAPYSSDYTRYVPKTTSPARVFWLVFAGLAGSSLAMEIFGFVTASGLTDTSPNGFIRGVAALSGPLAPIVLLIIASATIASSSVNTTTASYSLISAGVKITRPVSAIVACAIAYVLAVAGAGGFTDLYTNYMFLLLYWISPWIGIVLADWFLVPHGERAVHDGWQIGATIFAIVTPLTILLFSATDAYTGPVAKLLGGIDVGYYVGFFAAGFAYIVAKRDRRALAGESATQIEPA